MDNSGPEKIREAHEGVARKKKRQADMSGDVVRPADPTVYDIGDKSGDADRPARFSDAAEDNDPGCGRS